MANKSSDTKITRISATSDKKTKAPEKIVAASTKTAPAKAKKQRKNPLRAIGAYFAGAWHELRQVRWPDRRATWSMTVALIGFTAFFVILILLLDALFKYLFQLMLG